MGLPHSENFNLFSNFRAGPKNLITDVAGVKVGHVTRIDENRDIHTGVTALLPHEGNIFKDKVAAACSVINGFGKSIGLLQVQELGNIETPILMTNTLSIGTVFNGLCKYMLEGNPDIGVTTGTVNCLVTECNDGTLNDIRGFHVKEEDVYKAIENADFVFEEGCVGGGAGMCCLGLKGGIGSSSRMLKIDEKDYTVGALVMSNFGAAGHLVIGGKHYDTPGEIKDGAAVSAKPSESRDKGSIIMVIATDIPLSGIQLGRVAKRATVALGRTGSFCGNGSGDIAIAFTTANRVPHYSESSVIECKMLLDDKIDAVFEASVEAVEEAIISSLYYASTTVGIRGTKALSLKDFLSGKNF